MSLEEHLLAVVISFFVVSCAWVWARLWAWGFVAEIGFSKVADMGRLIDWMAFVAFFVLLVR